MFAHTREPTAEQSNNYTKVQKGEGLFNSLLFKFLSCEPKMESYISPCFDATIKTKQETQNLNNAFGNGASNRCIAYGWENAQVKTIDNVLLLRLRAIPPRPSITP